MICTKVELIPLIIELHEMLYNSGMSSHYTPIEVAEYWVEVSWPTLGTKVPSSHEDPGAVTPLYWYAVGYAVDTVCKQPYASMAKWLGENNEAMRIVAAWRLELGR